MFRKSILYAFQVLLFAVSAFGIHSQALAAPVRIMPLGDSITAGPGCWRAFLWNQLQTAGYTDIDFVGTVSDGGGCNPGFSYDFNHEGHGGFSATGIADNNQLPPWLSASSPDIVLMHLGTNDMWGGFIPLQNKLDAITKLVGQMRANNPNMKIIVAQIIPMSPSNCSTCAADVVAFNNAIPGWAASLTTPQSPILVVDQWTGFDVVADTYDGVHPVTSGFVKMANRWFPVLAQVLGNTTPGTNLTVIKAGSGSGTVTSSPSGINCGSTCSASFTSGAVVTLTATAASGSTFAGWNGACTGMGACTVSMTASRNVTATFNTTGTGGTCANPITFTNNTGNFNTTGAVCYRTSSTINGWGCSNFAGRTLTVGGQARTCGQLPLTRSSDGYYYFAVTAGTYPWASLYTW
jgi:lysophospholipase L1-like esterase